MYSLVKTSSRYDLSMAQLTVDTPHSEHMRFYLCMHSLHMYMHVCVCMCGCVCMHMYAYVCVGVYVCICIYICMYVWVCNHMN